MVLQIKTLTSRCLAVKYNTKYYKNYKDLLDSDVDALSICLPDMLHVDACCDVAKANKHILVEKPLAHNHEARKK